MFRSLSTSLLIVNVCISSNVNANAPVSQVNIQEKGELNSQLYQDIRKPEYKTTGEIVFPKDFRRWIHIGSSIGLTYANPFHQQQHKVGGPGDFKNVYIEPSAFSYYKKTGKFAEGTMFVATIYSSSKEDKLADHGYFQSHHLYSEMAIKDHSVYEEGWVYATFPREHTPVKALPKTTGCFECHQKNATDDNVFVQYYPWL